MSRIKPYIFFLLCLPSIFWLYKYINGNLGINPIDKLMDKLGEFALQLLIATLFLSSLSKQKNFRSLQILRRMIGLFVFYYVCLHIMTYIVLDYFFNWKLIFKDILKRPFITFGFISFVLFLPLVFTSTNSMIKKLTYRVWKNLHKLIYIIAPLVTLHYFLLTKADKKEEYAGYLTNFFSGKADGGPVCCYWRKHSRQRCGVNNDSRS